MSKEKNTNPDNEYKVGTVKDRLLKIRELNEDEFVKDLSEEYKIPLEIKKARMAVIDALALHDSLSEDGMDLLSELSKFMFYAGVGLAVSEAAKETVREKVGELPEPLKSLLLGAVGLEEISIELGKFELGESVENKQTKSKDKKPPEDRNKDQGHAGSLFERVFKGKSGAKTKSDIDRKELITFDEDEEGGTDGDT